MKIHSNTIHAVIGFLLMILAAASVHANDRFVIPPQQIKQDLVGQTMGGRDKAWKFQSVEQIRKLTIVEENQDENKLDVSINLILRDRRVEETYRAGAKVHYKRENSKYHIRYKGLLSFDKL